MKPDKAPAARRLAQAMRAKGFIPMREFLCMESERLNLRCHSVFAKIKRGKYPALRFRRINPRVVYVSLPGLTPAPLPAESKPPAVRVPAGKSKLTRNLNFRCECGVVFPAPNQHTANRHGCPECRRITEKYAGREYVPNPFAKYGRTYQVLLPRR